MYCEPYVDGVPYVRWIHLVFGDCVYGWQESISVLLGYLSILCWLNAQMPQVVENYKLRSAESLSFSFLSVWLTGDFANLIGCIVLDQLPFQIYLSIYFILVDTVLCLQWIWYVRLGKGIPLPATAESDVKDLDGPREPQVIDVPRPSSSLSETSGLIPYSQSASPSKWYTLAPAAKDKSSVVLFALFFLVMQTPSSTLTTNSTLSAFSSPSTSDESTLWVGRFFAWLCTCLYLSSRIPQILKNYRRRSVQGLSIALFLFAACGNLTYTLSIFTNPHSTRESLLEAVPYILGSAGTLLFDMTIFSQYVMYNWINRKATFAIE
ncbi:PQ loop repeat-domain-containing protein [Umbelopsis sp. AD052]|nr:PQ loop repeat-domain-containing protein [Umbelopsis sp. AD052]